MIEINGFTEADIISSLRMGVELAGDGGCSPWAKGEYEACMKYLDELESRLKSKNSVECWECDTIFHYTDSDIDNVQVKCPCCDNVIVLLN